MFTLTLLALAIAPGLAVVIFIIRRDLYNAEPAKLLVISFLLGIFTIVPAIVLEEIGIRLGLAGSSTLLTMVSAFIVIAGSEELCKFLALRFYAYRKTAFDEPFDGITYSVMVAMGFATLENIMYVFQYGIGTGILRMFTAVPAHAVFGITMGYYAGLAKFHHNEASNLLKGLVFAILLHGAYDYFLMEENIPGIAIGALVSLFIGIRFSRRAIKMHQERSPFREVTGKDSV